MAVPRFYLHIVPGWGCEFASIRRRTRLRERQFQSETRSPTRRTAFSFGLRSSVPCMCRPSFIYWGRCGEQPFRVHVAQHPCNCVVCIARWDPFRPVQNRAALSSGGRGCAGHGARHSIPPLLATPQSGLHPATASFSKRPSIIFFSFITPTNVYKPDTPSPKYLHSRP